MASFDGPSDIAEGGSVAFTLASDDLDLAGASATIGCDFAFTTEGGTAGADDCADAAGSGTIDAAAIASGSSVPLLRPRALSDALFEGPETVFPERSLTGIAFADGFATRRREITLRDAPPMGAAAGDALGGGAREDRLYGRGGDDRLLGGEGADRVRDEEGDDRLRGGRGEERLLRRRRRRPPARVGTCSAAIEARMTSGEGRAATGCAAGSATTGLRARTSRMARRAANGSTAGWTTTRCMAAGGGERADAMDGGPGADVFVFVFVFASGADRVADFASGEGAIEVDDPLWRGRLDLADVLSAFGVITGGARCSTSAAAMRRGSRGWPRSPTSREARRSFDLSARPGGRGSLTASPRPLAIPPRKPTRLLKNAPCREDPR